MLLRVALAGAALLAVAFVIWHPARPPVVQSIVASPAPLTSDSLPMERSAYHRRSRPASGDDLVVYVAGAVKRPGLYRLRAGDRDARAIELAGGFRVSADQGGVNLAQRAADGDEIYVPATGETHRDHSSQRHGRRHVRTPSDASVDVNRAQEGELAAVPGIGRAIAQRIVELREREGSFTSLDQLLDVAGMTQTRLDRARPYLREP
jgi:competence protein ComEA